MITPDINHRYRGWRESAKLVQTISCGAADLCAALMATAAASAGYLTRVRDKSYSPPGALDAYREAGASGSCLDDINATCQSAVQHARALAQFARRLV